jgi:hypothetical protein
MLEKSSVSNVLLARRRRNNKMGEAGICSAQLRIGGAVGGANGELSRPGTRTEQVVKAQFFRNPRTFKKPLAPRVGCSVLLENLIKTCIFLVPYLGRISFRSV